jgi:hypothetical protein
MKPSNRFHKLGIVPDKPHISCRHAAHMCLSSCIPGSVSGASTLSTMTCRFVDVVSAVRLSSAASNSSQTLLQHKPTGPIQTNHNTPTAPPPTMAANPSPTVRP